MPVLERSDERTEKRVAFFLDGRRNRVDGPLGMRVDGSLGTREITLQPLAREKRDFDGIVDGHRRNRTNRRHRLLKEISGGNDYFGGLFNKS